MKNRLIFGGRLSLLARIQTALVAQRLRELEPELEFEFFFKETTADQDLHIPLWQMQTKGAFTYEFSRLLLQNKIDIVVHSYKDMALESQPGTEVIPVLPRGDQRDLLLFKKEALARPPKQILIFTSSLRRMFLLDLFLKRALPRRLHDCRLHFESIRGNVPTRLKKLIDSPGHGLVLSKAALDRMLCKPSVLLLEPKLMSMEELERNRRHIRTVLAQCEFMVLPLSLCPNAPAQGSLAVEIRKDDRRTRELILQLSEASNTYTSLEERRHLSRFGGGCHQKIGISCLERYYGRVQYIRGVGDVGQPFFQRSFEANSERMTRSSQIKPPGHRRKLWPLPGERLEFKRSPLVPPSIARIDHIWISRSEAWPAAWTGEGKILWAAGSQTLLRLAKRDIWVHGCADGLGEDEDAGIDLILGQPSRFVKLSHQRKSAGSRWESIPTYKLELAAGIPDLRGRTHFFWKSGSQFDLVTQCYPQLQNACHASGPGLTGKYIQKKVLGPVTIFLDYDNWLETMQELLAAHDQK